MHAAIKAAELRMEHDVHPVHALCRAASHMSLAKLNMYMTILYYGIDLVIKCIMIYCDA